VIGGSAPGGPSLGFRTEGAYDLLRHQLGSETAQGTSFEWTGLVCRDAKVIYSLILTSENMAP
jgi:hypothetical protein